MAESGSTTLRSVQALRALAVAVVVVFHLWPHFLTGGYIGVDVFFVISGYLITAHLLSEVVRTSTVRLRAFWARRIRRLLPASLTVLGVTALAVLLVAPVALWRQDLREIMASALYFENWMLAATSVDYLAEDGAMSPVTHFWSLSVEEQFYLVWPILVLGGAVLARRVGLSPRRTLVATMASVAVLSLAASVVVTQSAPDLAYYGTHVRAWEFAAGALVALLLPRGTPWSSATRVAMSWAGTATIVGAALAFGAATPFPGIAATVPVTGAVLVLIAGETQGRLAPDWWHRRSWVQWLGDNSYSIYLWHWPLIVLVPMAVGRDLSTSHRIAILVVTLVLAGATKRWIEDPWRRPRDPSRPRYALVYGGAAVGMASVVVLAGGGWWWAKVDAEQSLDAADRITELPQEERDCFGAPSGDPELQDTCGEIEWDEFIPSAPAIGEDIPALYGDECETDATSADVKPCEFGDPTSEQHVVLVGDSHAAQWFPALEELAKTNGWRLTAYFKAACSYTASADRMTSDKYRPACTEWNAAVAEELTAEPVPDLVVTSAVRSHRFVDDTGEISDVVAAEGYAEAWEDLIDAGTVVAAIVDNPQMSREAVECIRATEGIGEECGRDRAAALERPDYMSSAVALVDGAYVVDFNDLLCVEAWCPQVIGGAVVYRDTSSHLTETWVRTLTPYFERRLPLSEAGLSPS